MAQDRQFSWRRSLAWALSLALHLGLLVAMTLPRDPERPTVVVDPVQAEAWVPVAWAIPPTRDPAIGRDGSKPLGARRAEIPPPVEIAPRPETTQPRAERARSAAERVTSLAPTQDATASVGARPAPIARTIAYLDDEARALLPHENLYSAEPPPREGDYYTPGDGSEDDVFDRPRALDPNPSRFAQAWQPRGSLIDDWLGRLVEKTTGQVSVPLNAKFSLVCQGTLLGMGGGCVIVRNGGTGVIVQRPPPAPWDRSNRVQCRELRQALEDAEEAVQVAYFLDRLSALCSPGTGTGIDTPDDAAGNDEARRKAGLPEETDAPDAAPTGDQRAL